MSYSLHLFADTPAAITAAVDTPYLVDRVYGAAITSTAAVAIGVADAAAALHSRHLYCCSAVAVDIAGASAPLAASSFATATTVLSPSLVTSNVCTAPPLLTPYPFTVNVADAAAAGRPTSVPFRCYRCRSPLTVAAGSLLPPPPLLWTSLAILIVCTAARHHLSHRRLLSTSSMLPYHWPPHLRTVPLLFSIVIVSYRYCSPPRKRRSPPATPPRPLAVAARAPAFHERGNKFDFGTPNPLDSFVEQFKCTVIIANSGSS